MTPFLHATVGSVLEDRPAGLLLAVVYWAVVTISCVHALRFGGRSERLGAAVIAAASLLSALLSSSGFAALEGGIFVVDLATWLALMFLAFRSNRYWPLWAAGFHSVAVVTHAAMFIDRSIVPAAYAIGQGLWAYPILIALMVGSEHRRRDRALGATAAARF